MSDTWNDYDPPKPEPTEYERQESFKSFESSNPDKPKPGSKLDAEFDQIKHSLKETQNRLRMLQAEDGRMRNEVVHYDALSDEARGELESAVAQAQKILSDIEEIEVDMETAKKAEAWAAEEPDVEVADGLYSARHYAKKAEEVAGTVASDLIDDDSRADFLTWSSLKIGDELDALSQAVDDAKAAAKTHAENKADEAEQNAKAHAESKASEAEQNAKDYIDAETVRQTQDNTLTGENAFTKPAHFEAGYYEPKYIAWNARTDSYAGNPGPTLTHEQMRRCVMDDHGNVVYYLDPNDSNYKEDGGEADLSGGDGQVMVEIPKFWTKTEFRGDWQYRYVSPFPLDGYEVHPAFKPGGQEVDAVYIGAFDAAVYSASDDEWIDGLNLDDNTDRVGLGGDYLGSIKGMYPMVGLQRSEFRTLAGNLGDGHFHLADFWLIQAIQLLYLVEYGDHHSQAKVGRGNVDRSYSSSSSNQSDSPHVESGLSAEIGNDSGSVDDDAGEPWMSYRGIEHLWGNTGEWIDGFNIDDRQAYVANDPAGHEDDTAGSPYEAIGEPMPSASGDYIERWQEVADAFIPAATGASSTSHVTDALRTDTGWRVALFGGRASRDDRAGAFFWHLSHDSGHRLRLRGARVARRVPATEE